MLKETKNQFVAYCKRHNLVLILILMEHAQREIQFQADYGYGIVLILILMEHAQRELFTCSGR